MSGSAVLAEQGMALLVTLLMLIAVLLLGASAARTAMLGEKAARAERDRYVALQAAEDALADAEREINGGAASAPARTALLAAGNGLGFVPDCGLGTDNPALGLCAYTGGDAPVWEAVDLGDDGAATRSVPFGRYTGAIMETGQGFLPFKRPRYIIERVPYHPPGEDAGAMHYFYRVTAIGFGAKESTEVVLQGSYRRADGGGMP
ncbi:PilX N-terminal domain-containing pilus assembly protein [Massilia sp. Root351]|uniref:pilus assembly PilX family protein n=1 Tax=Massilia sp. Root351 TaxID=1736522 RepID=UPI0009E74E6F|nr:pilus assembly protein [Massilia sp. Root351]